MRKALAIHSVIFAIAIAIGAAMAFGQYLGARDKKLFAADDERRTRMIARSCGKTGELFQAADSKKYSCLWRNRDGAVLLTDVPDVPYLEHIAQR